jgi:hypothetical protein
MYRFVLAVFATHAVLLLHLAKFVDRRVELEVSRGTESFSRKVEGPFKRRILNVRRKVLSTRRHIAIVSARECSAASAAMMNNGQITYRCKMLHY